MRMRLIILMLLIVLLIVSGCTNKALDTFNEEKEQLNNEIIDLKKLVSEKDEVIMHLKKANSYKETQLKEVRKSLEMVRYSSYARLEDYYDTFENLKEIYKINSNYIIKDDWYVISDEYFQIELLEHKNAKKVDFYTLRLDSGEGPVLVSIDTDSTDGWIYINDNISEIINKHKKPLYHGGFSYVPDFVIYTEVTLEDGNIIRTSKLPIYNE